MTDYTQPVDVKKNLQLTTLNTLVRSFYEEYHWDCLMYLLNVHNLMYGCYGDDINTQLPSVQSTFSHYTSI